MTSPREFTSEPFDFLHGGILCVEAKATRAGALGLIEFHLEGSEDKTYWVELHSGSVSRGQRVEVPCQDRVATWGRIRLRALDGGARVSLRRFPEGSE